MKKRSNMKKLFPVIAMLLVSAITLSSATYAWFTMSRIVKAEGMQMNVVAPTSLLISATNETGSYKASATANETFMGTGAFRLVPASSTDGINFFSTAKIDDENNGAATEDTNFFDVSDRPLKRIAKTVDDYEYKDTETDYAGPTEDGYYADFTFWLKASGDADVEVKVSYLTSLIADLTTSDSKDITEAVRFAILDATTPATPVVFTNASLYANTANLATANDDSRFLGDAVGPVPAPLAATDAHIGVETDINTDTVLFTCDKGGTPVPIIIRVWIEGQDTACVTSNAGSDLKMTVGFRDKLVDDADIK